MIFITNKQQIFTSLIPFGFFGSYSMILISSCHEIPEIILSNVIVDVALRFDLDTLL